MMALTRAATSLEGERDTRERSNSALYTNGSRTEHICGDSRRHFFSQHMSRRLAVKFCLLCTPLLLIAILTPSISVQVNSVEDITLTTPPPELLPPPATTSPTTSPTTARPTTGPTASPTLCVPGVVTCCIAADDEVVEIFVDDVNITSEMVVYDGGGAKDTYIVQFVEPRSTSVFAFTGHTASRDGSYAFHCMCTREESPWNMLTSFPPEADVVGPADASNYSFPTGWRDVDYLGPFETLAVAPANASAELSNAATLLPQCAPATANFSAILIQGVFPQTFWAVRTIVPLEYDCTG